MTKEQIYREQMQALGIYEEIFEPEIRTLARIERECTRAEKAWSATAAPGGKPSFLDPHYQVIQRLRAEILQHRETLGLTPKALRKLTGATGTDAPQQKDLIASRLDALVDKVSQYGEVLGPAEGFLQAGSLSFLSDEDAAPGEGSAPAGGFGGVPIYDEMLQASDQMDAQDHPEEYDLKKAVAEDMG